jgi:hypothetical protein
MAIVKVDVSNPDLGKKKEFPCPEPGDYTLRVNNLPKVEKSEKSGNMMSKLELEILDEGEYKGQKVFDYLVFTKDSEWKLYQFARSAGIEIAEDGSIDLDLAQGAIVEATLKPDAYKKDDGTVQMNAKVKEYLYERDPDEENQG